VVSELLSDSNGWPITTGIVRSLARLALAAALCTPVGAFASDAQAHLGAGLKLLEREEESRAAREFELALKGDPNLLEARYYLALCNFNLGEFPKARQGFDRLVARGFQKDRATYYLGRIDLAESNVDSAIVRFTSLDRQKPVADESYYLGLAYMKKGDPEKAVSALEAATRLQPHDFRAHELLARAYLKLGRARDAGLEFEEGRRAHEYETGMKGNTADCRQQLLEHQFDEAWALCGQPVLVSADVDRMIGYGVLFGEAGQYDRSLQLLHRAVQLDPESPDANYNIGYTYFQERDYGKAGPFLEAAVASRPHFFEALELYGTVLYIRHDDTRALKVLQEAHQLRPDSASVNRLLQDLDRTQPE
jgi:tetratricopeptide (TPR) repeat protein